MTEVLDAGATRALRLRSQRLVPRARRAVDGLVAGLVGIQAQDPKAAALALRVRSADLVAGGVECARDEERSLVWTWAMRGTLHLVPAADAGWILGLLGPIFVAAGRPRRRALGLTDELCERALPELREILADAGPLGRREIVRRLGARGVDIDPAGQAPAHLLAYAALRGVLCRAGSAHAAGEPSYDLLEDRLGAPPAAVAPDDAPAELACRYVGAHGPAGAADLAAWAGIGLRRARRALELAGPRLRPVDAPSGRAFVLAGEELCTDPAGSPHVALLGHFDPYLLGYADRDLALDRRFARRIQAGGGFIQPAVLVDGRVAGTWRRERRGARLDVVIEPFDELDEKASAAVAAEAADVARFLGAAGGEVTFRRTEGARPARG